MSVVSGPLLLMDSRLGMIALQRATYWQCASCKAKLYPLETVRQIEQEKRKQREELVRAHSIGEFLNAADTAATLGISRQALHKHHRISNGFIYQTRLSGKTVYLKKSVMLFKEVGDGRFPLAPTVVPQVKYGSPVFHHLTDIQNLYISSGSTQAVNAYTGSTRRGQEQTLTTKVFQNVRY
jgi:hypothetical protein